MKQELTITIDVPEGQKAYWNGNNMVFVDDGDEIPELPKSWEEFREITNEMAELYARKNADYGDSFGQTYRELGIISAVTRMSDKMNRLKRLTTREYQRAVGDESIDDTLMDMACYAVMTLMERRR